MQKKLVNIILFLVVFLVATGISYNAFLKKPVTVTTPTQTTEEIAEQGNDYQAIVFDQTLPRTEECPLSGALYSTEQKSWWENHRPLGIMIENHAESRPQSGISFSDVTYEAVAEGGITRTLNVYYCQDAGIVGPVRSARTYFLDFISEYGEYPLYAHVGGANTPGPANALGQIGDYGWNAYNDLNQFSIGFPTFWRDQTRLGHDVATEHTMYASTSKLWAVGEKRKLTNVDEDGVSWDEDFVMYKFKDDAPKADRPASQTVHVEFWNDPAYYVDWIYDKEKNIYMRENGGEAHIDRNTNKQLSAKNIIILFMRESHANDGYENNVHLLYDTEGSGKAMIFMDGKEIDGTWEKEGRTDKTILYDNNGEEVEFDRGKLWFEILDPDSVVNVE